jgi:hypothetical protein
MLNGHCPACLLPFQHGDECKEVGNNTIMVVIGKKSGQMIMEPLTDPLESVIVHRHCTVAHEDPRSNEEYMAAVEEAQRPAWESDWADDNLERIRSEAYELANDDLKSMCAGCYEEIEHMGAKALPPKQPVPHTPPLPWGVTS